MYKKTLVILLLCLSLSSCGTIKKIQHLPQLLTIKHFSDEQDAIAEAVKERNQLFDGLVQEIEKGKFNYITARQVKKRFGEPIFKRKEEHRGRILNQWLYRYAKDFDGDKVYMYFDNRGSLIDFNYVKEASKKENGSAPD